MAAAVKSSAGMAVKKSRKPYVITRPRERWTADEHDRFLHALLLFPIVCRTSIVVLDDIL
jgi:hypothetical protein